MAMRNWTGTFAATWRVNFFFILLIGCLLMVAVAKPSFESPGEVPSKECHLMNKKDGVKAVCSNLARTSIPSYLPPNTIILLASYNRIADLTNDSFKNLSQLITLNVRANLISHLDVGTFWPLTRLQILNMAQNQLTKLPDYIFNSNTLLRQVVLSNNRFSSVPTDALATLSQLQVISLSQNEIRKLQPSDLEPIQTSYLKRFSLAGNTFGNLPPGIFSHLYRVDVLDLAANVLEEFHVDSFLGNMNINRLSLLGCRILDIVPLNTSYFSNMTSPVIDFLELTGNRIIYIPPNAFWGFNRTRILNISQNLIMDVYNKSFCGLDSLVHLDISSNLIASLPSKMFFCNPKLQELIISHNYLFTMDPPSFIGLSVLHKLDLSHNYLDMLDRYPYCWDNPALQFLDISHNGYRSFSGDLLCNLESLLILDMSYNQIRTFSRDTFDNVPSLQDLSLKGMSSEAKMSLDRVFSQMMNLTKLDLSFTEISFESIYQFRNTTSLEELRMCENKLKSTDLFDKASNVSVFEGLVSLKNLSLRANHLNSLDPGVFGPLRELQSLDLSRSFIVILNPGVFKGLISLRSLYLQDNNISTTSATLFSGLDNLGSLLLQNNTLQILDKATFVATPSLHNLNLSYNRLSEVQKDTFFPTKKTLFIDVSENPFACTCALSWFRTWLDGSNTIFVNIDKTLCSRGSLKAVIHRPILAFDPTDICGINIILITALCLFACTVSVVCVTVYRKRYPLNHKVVKLAIACSGKIVENFKASNYDFHLNLMFHDSEEEWVDRVMKPVLEERFPHIHNIVYGDEDLRLDMFYINALYDAIENSFKTVLLLSNQSIYDIWTMTKLRLALEHVDKTGLDKVILIFLEDIGDDNMPNLVKLFLSRNKTHLWWTDDEDERDLFWAHFDRSMQGNRVIINAFPI